MCEITTTSGASVNLLRIQPGDINPLDVAHSLANTNRFGGKTRFPYSVAQHSWVLSYMVPEDLAKAAFLHDWSEAFVGDIVTPLKALLPGFCAIEDAIQRVIFAKYQVPWEHMDLIHPYDKFIGQEEWRQLFEPSFQITRYTIEEWHWTEAKERFLDRFVELFDE